MNTNIREINIKKYPGKLISKCRLQNGFNFVSTSVC